MPKKVSFALLWLGLVAYALFLAPPISPDTLDLVKRLSLGETADVNPLIVALFYLLILLPFLYSCVLFADGRGQKIRAFPFLIGTFVLGSLATIPYLALRQSNPTFTGEKGRVIRFFDSRLFAFFVTAAIVLVIAFGVVKGNWSDFLVQWKTSRFIHFMSLDFCLLCLLFPLLVGNDLARRNLQNSVIFWAIALLPLFGPLIYLCLRPPLVEMPIEKQSLSVAMAER